LFYEEGFFLPNIKNELGNIFIDNEVIARIAGMAAMDCYGIVGMAIKNVKDGFVHLLKRESLTKGIKLYDNDNLLSLDLHIIVEFGTNISAIVETLTSTVKYRLEENLGFNVDKINIFIEGIRVDS
jgi:Uncharacterized protein conserved in bacteria